MAETARSQLRKLKDEYARNPNSRVFVHLAEAYRKSGELRQAQQVLTDGLRRHVDDPSGLVVLARVLTDQGEVERAAGVWRDVLRQDPENVVALRSLAELADSAGRRDEAMQLFRRVLRLENGEPDVDEQAFAAPSFDDEDDDAPAASAPAAAPQPPPAPAAAPSKSRFSWLVRSVGRTLAGDPAPEPAAPPVGRDLLATPAAAPAQAPAPAEAPSPAEAPAPAEVPTPAAAAVPAEAPAPVEVPTPVAAAAPVEAPAPVEVPTPVAAAAEAPASVEDAAPEAAAAVEAPAPVEAEAQPPVDVAPEEMVYQADEEQEETVFEVQAARDAGVFQGDDARDDTVFQVNAAQDHTLFQADAARDGTVLSGYAPRPETVFAGDVEEAAAEDAAFVGADAGQGDEAAFGEDADGPAIAAPDAHPASEETAFEADAAQEDGAVQPSAAPEIQSAFTGDGVPIFSAAAEPEPAAAEPEEARFPVEPVAEAAQPEDEPSTPGDAEGVVEVVPVLVVNVFPEEPEAGEPEPEEEQAPEPDERVGVDEPEIETQEEIVASDDYEDEAEGQQVPEFAELAQLAYQGAAEPAPDPLARVRAQMFGAHGPEHEDGEPAGGAAALAEVLVRLLERDGTSIRAESSLRRLLAAALARELGLPEAQQESLALAALLGALGELAEPAPDGAATGRQLSITLQLLSGVALPAVAREALAHQYERWDGGGLPSGLREDQIPFPARILAVARGAAALLGQRGRGPATVVDELQREAGSAFDPIVVSVLRRVFAQRERHGIGYGWGGRVAVAHPRELRALELASRLHGEGYAAETAGTADALRDRLRIGAPGALVLGADLPDADAVALVRELRSQSPTLPVLVVDAPDARRRVELLGAGADVCFPPDADFLEVRATLDALLRRGEA